MKTYRKHNCTRQHRTARTFLACAFPRHLWIRGKGDIALIACLALGLRVRVCNFAHLHTELVQLWDAIGEAE